MSQIVLEHSRRLVFSQDQPVILRGPPSRREGVIDMTSLNTMRIGGNGRKEAMQMKELIKYIAEAVVDNPKSVDVQEVNGEYITIYELRVDGEDIGRIIGKEGRMVNAIRTVLVGASIKRGRRTNLQIIK
jgi:predicted RNA-binding protein YlqC (UPF0109 family)